MKPFTFENLPQELRASHRWLVWKYGPEERRNKNTGKLPKDPIDLKSGHMVDRKLAAVLSFDQAVNAAPKFSGIGLLSSGRLIAVDFDNCVTDGVIDERAEAAIRKLNSYTEISPSEKGIRVWVFGDAPRDPVKSEINPFAGTASANRWARKGKFVEIYPDSPSSNYVSATGWRLPGYPAEVRELSDEEVRELYSWADKPSASPAPQAVDSKPRLTRLQRFNILSLGHWQELHTSQSEADLEYCVFLAESHNGDEKKIEADFRESKLYRPPSIKAGDYIGRTIRSAIDKWKTNPRFERLGKVEYVCELIITKGSDITERAQEYLWEPYLPLGQLVHFGGAQAQGKSPVVVDLAARLTIGKEWPDQAPAKDPKAVILMGIEDDPATVTVPRFKLAGGQLDRLYFVQGTRMTAENTKLEKGVALDRDMELLAGLARKTENLGMIVIDPITNYLGKVKMNAEEEVRTILTPLALLAAELNIVVVSVGHFNRRDKGTDPLNRLMGAAAFTGVARGVTLFGPDPDIENTHHHIMTSARGDTEAGGMKYHTEIELIEIQGKKSKVVKVLWDGKAEVHADDTTDGMSRSEKSKKSAGVELIKGFLSGGKRQATECLSFLKQNGIDPEKITPSRILKAAGGKSVQEGRAWWWMLGTGEEGPPMF